MNINFSRLLTIMVIVFMSFLFVQGTMPSTWEQNVKVAAIFVIVVWYFVPDVLKFANENYSKIKEHQNRT